MKNTHTCKSATLAKYRLIHRPDETIDVFDCVPYMPPQTKYHHKQKHDYHREIAWTVDYRGDNDDIPAILYVGAGYTLVKDVMFKIFGKTSVAFNGFKIYYDYFPFPRQQKACVRVAVEFYDLNDTITLQNLGLLLENVIRKECWCNIEFVKLNKLLNL